MWKFKAFLPVAFLVLLVSRTVWSQAPPWVQQPDTSYRIVQSKTQSKTQTYSQILEYPRIKGCSRAEAQKQLNAIIATGIHNFSLDFKTRALKEAGQQRMPFEQICTYEIKWQSEKILALVMTDLVFLGGAHPDYQYLTLNYDFTRSKLLQLSDLFKPGSGYLTVLASYCSTYLQQKPDADKEFIKSGTAPTAQNYRNFYLTPKNLVIFFPPVQVACYAAGVQEVPIPYTGLKGMLKAGYH